MTRTPGVPRAGRANAVAYAILPRKYRPLRKLAYANTFGESHNDLAGAYVITTDRGLIPPDTFVDIDSTTPISDRTVAELSLQGVTGLLYVDLLELHNNRTVSPPVPSLKYPVIRSGPSRFDVFLASLPQLVAAAGDVVQRVDRLLSDSNLGAVSGALANLDKSSAGVPQAVRELNALIHDLRGATAQLTASAKSTRTVVESVGPEVLGAVQRIHAIADSLANAAWS